MFNRTSAKEVVIAEYEVVDSFQKFTAKPKGKKQWSNQEQVKQQRKIARKNAGKGNMVFSY